jgi:hypothetical protein
VGVRAVPQFGRSNVDDRSDVLVVALQQTIGTMRGRSEDASHATRGLLRAVNEACNQDERLLASENSWPGSCHVKSTTNLASEGGRNTAGVIVIKAT